MPTTDSSAASVTSPFFAWTSREMGWTLWAKSQATIPTSGIDTAVYRASRGLTTSRITPAPMIIRKLCTPWTSPQPTK